MNRRSWWVPWLYVLVGTLLGLFCGGSAGIALFLSPATGSEHTEISQPPADYAVRASVTEGYIARIMLDQTPEMGVPLIAGDFSLRPGGRGDFAVTLELGPLRPVVRGAVALRATAEGRLHVDVINAHLGRLPIKPFIPSGTLATINESANDELLGRLGPTGLTLSALTSDETTLYLYFDYPR